MPLSFLLASVAGVQPQVTEALEEAGPRGFEQELCAIIAVGDVRPVDLGHEHQSLGVQEQMTLSSFDLLGPFSIAALFSAHPGCLYRLRVHYGGAGLGVPLQVHPNPLAQG
jgi:hemin uptake protein HemP